MAIEWSVFEKILRDPDFSLPSRTASSESSVPTPSVTNRSEPPSFTEPQSIVTILVGGDPEPKRFSVHKETLCYYSPVFNKAFNGVFLEGETQTMTLEDVEASVFGLLVSWLYTGDIAARESRQHDNSFKLYQKPTQLAKLWILGERFLMPQLQNRVVNEIFPAIEGLIFDREIYKSIEDEAPAELIKSFVQFSYSAGSPTLQKLAVSTLGRRCPEEIFMELIDGLPKEAWLDVAKALKSGEEMWAKISTLQRTEFGVRCSTIDGPDLVLYPMMGRESKMAAIHCVNTKFTDMRLLVESCSKA